MRRMMGALLALGLWGGQAQATVFDLSTPGSYEIVMDRPTAVGETFNVTAYFAVGGWGGSRDQSVYVFGSYELNDGNNPIGESGRFACCSHPDTLESLYGLYRGGGVSVLSVEVIRQIVGTPPSALSWFIQLETPIPATMRVLHTPGPLAGAGLLPVLLGLFWCCRKRYSV